MKQLIVFYSRAGENYFEGQHRYIEIGNTEKAAHIIAELTGAALWKLEQKIPYAEDYATCVAQARTDFQRQARPELISVPANLDAYDVIYLGYPNYCGTMPMAVYTFLEAFDFSGKTIHPFCTHAGSGLSNTVQDIKAAAKGASVTEGLALIGSQVDDAKDLIKQWIK